MPFEPGTRKIVIAAIVALLAVLSGVIAWNMRLGLLELFCSAIIVALGITLIRRLKQLAEANEKVLRVSQELEEERYQSMLATIIDGFWLIDITNGRLMEVNDAYCRLSGYSREELLRMQVSDLEAVEQPEDTRVHICKIVDEGVDRFETRHRRKDGTEVDVEVSISYLPKRQRFLVFIRDITRKLRAEQELRKQASLMKGVLESTDAAVFSVDSSYRYTSFNTAHARTMKLLYGVDTRRGDSIIAAMTSEDAVETQANLDRTLAGEAFVVEADSGDAQRLRTVFEISHNPIRNADGTIIGVAVFSHDISERRRSEESLREMQGQLMQNDKLASIGQLAAGVAHEINNPMGFISSNLSTLGKYIEKYNHYIGMLEEEMRTPSGQLPEQVASAKQRLKMEYVMRDIGMLVEESNDGVERVKRIVQDLRTFSRSDTTTTYAVDLNQCIDSTINIIMNEVKYSAELKREYGELPKVSCNMQKVSQVFMNLLINAAHSIQAKGSAFGRITIGTWCNDDNAFVSISDTGCGIPPENMGRIFDAFYTTKEVGKGTGLGLSISSELIRKHGGEIMVASELGVGTTFTVRLPLRQAQGADEGRQ